MKKIVSLAIVLILVVSMATTAFAAPADQYPEVVNGQCTVNPADGKAFIMLDPNAVVTVLVPSGTGCSVSTYGYHGDDFIEGGYNLIISKVNQIQSSAKGEAFGKMVADQFMLQNLTGDTAYVIVTIDTTGSGPVAGTWDKPDTLVLGTNTAKVEAASDGYYYNWTAEADGELIITMPSGQWVYSISNVTKSKYGTRHQSNDRPVVKTESIAVSAGDTVQIMVNTLNPSDVWNNPAGKVTFTASFGKTETHTHNATHFAAVKSECLIGGKIEHWYCSGCNNYWKDAALTQQTDLAGITLAATGHSYVNGICTGCGAAEYAEEETDPTTPTDATTPNTPSEGGEATSPDTGDAGIIGAVTGAVFSIVSAAAIVIKKKEF